MKSVIGLFVVAAFAMTANAQSGTTNKAAKKVAAVKTAKTAKKKTKKKKTTPNEALEAELDAGSQLPHEGDDLAPAADLSLSVDQQSVTKVSDASSQKILKRFSLSAAAETYGGVKGTNDGSGDMETDYTATLGYKINNQTSARLGLEMDTMNGFNGNKSDFGRSNTYNGFQDIYVGLARSNMLKTADGTAIHGQIRYYAPNSQLSQDKNQIGQVRVYGVAEKEIAKNLTASLLINPRFFIQSQDRYEAIGGKIKPTDNFRIYSSAGLKYAFSDLLAVGQTVGLYQKWWRSTNANYDSKRGAFLGASTSVYISPASWVEINAGIRQSDEATDLYSGHGKKNGIYSSEQSEYFLITSFSI